LEFFKEMRRAERVERGDEAKKSGKQRHASARERLFSLNNIFSGQKSLWRNIRPSECDHYAAQPSGES